MRRARQVPNPSSLMMRKHEKLPGLYKKRETWRYIVVMVTSKITKNKDVGISVLGEQSWKVRSEERYLVISLLNSISFEFIFSCVSSIFRKDTLLWYFHSLFSSSMFYNHTQLYPQVAQVANAGDAGSTPGSGRSPGEGNGNPLQYSGLEKPMDRGALAGCSPWCHKESDTTERLTLYPNLKQLRPLHLSVGRNRLM